MKHYHVAAWCLQVTVNEEVDPALVVERLKVENAMLKSELK